MSPTGRILLCRIITNMTPSSRREKRDIRESEEMGKNMRGEGGTREGRQSLGNCWVAVTTGQSFLL